MTEPLSPSARRILVAIAEGQHFRRRGRDWAVGPLAVPAAVIAELKRRDLIRSSAESLTLTEAGRAWIVRQLPANRLLAERALPEDGEERGRARSAPRKRSVTVNLAESPLGWLKARGLVDDRQFEAGERLRGDWTIAGLGPRVTMRWDGGARGTGDALDPTLAQVAAKRRTDAAFDAVGSGLRDVLWRVVCAGEGMETAERALGWPARAGRVVLTLALDRLADFYRLA